MTEAVIDTPTYLKHIRHFFTDENLDHMSQRGHDLSTYQGVRKDAVSVSQPVRFRTSSAAPRKRPLSSTRRIAGIRGL